MSADGSSDPRGPGAPISLGGGADAGAHGGAPGLPADPSLVEGRAPERPAEEIPELHEVDCPEELRTRIEQLMSRYPDRRSASIPALWAVQRRYGWCTPGGIRQAAAVMRVTPAYLESIASFYDLFHTEPAGSHRVLVCTNISCWMRGADEVLDAFSEAAGCDPAEARHGAVSPDGELYLSGFECLGACDIAPMASIDERYFGPLGPDEAGTAVEQLRAGRDPLPERALARRGAAGGPDPDPDERIAAMKGPNSGGGG